MKKGRQILEHNGTAVCLLRFPWKEKGGGGSVGNGCYVTSPAYFTGFCAFRVKKLQQMLDCCLKELSFLKISALNILKEL